MLTLSISIFISKTLILLTIICGQPIIHQHLLKRNKSKLSKNNFPNYTIISIDDDLTADEVVSDLHIKPNPATGLTVDDIIEIDELIKK